MITRCGVHKELFNNGDVSKQPSDLEATDLFSGDYLKVAGGW